MYTVIIYLRVKEVVKIATVYDIAKLCNLSTATVSYVLSGRGNEHRISPSTQKRILEAAETLGYSRKPANTQKRIKIAVYFMYSELEMLMPNVITGISNVISSEILPIDLIIRPYELNQLSNQSELWHNNECQAAIIVAAAKSDLDYLQTREPIVPIVLFNRVLDKYSYVTIDHKEAGILAAKHAISVGGNSISLVLNPIALYGLNLRASTIISTLKANGVNIEDNLFYSNNKINDGYELGWDMIRKNKLQKVIICLSDMVAMGIISALNEANIVVGKDIHVLATSSAVPSLFARCTPPMTVVDLKIEDIAERCTKLAIALIQKTVTEPQKIVLQPQIIYRQSSPMSPLKL